MNEIFPELRRLTLDSVHVSNAEIFNTKFPHLKHVKIRFSLPLDGEAPNLNDDDSLKNAMAIKNLFEKNPQIKNVVLVHCTKEQVKIVQTALPKLESFRAIHIRKRTEGDQ